MFANAEALFVRPSRNRLSELEATADQPTTPNHTRQLSIKLGDLDSNLHFELVDDEGTLEGTAR